MSWFGSCTHGHDQLLPLCSSSPSHAWGTGAELVADAGMEKTSPVGKAIRGEGVGAKQISEHCLESRWAGSKGWHREAGLARRPKHSANTCLLPCQCPALMCCAPDPTQRQGSNWVTIKHVYTRRLNKQIKTQNKTQGTARVWVLPCCISFLRLQNARGSVERKIQHPAAWWRGLMPGTLQALEQ